MDQGRNETSFEQRSRNNGVIRARFLVGVGAIVALVFGGCGLVSGLDDFEVVEPGSSSSTGAGGSSSSSGGTGDFVTIGGSVTGLLGTGFVLRNNGSDDIQIGMDGPFNFPAKVQVGASYNVTIASFPSSPSQSCNVSNGSGSASGSAVTDILITCSTSAHSVGGTVVGLSSSGMVLTNNGIDDLAVTVNAAFAFATKTPSGAPFDVVVKTQPAAGGPCVVSGGTGVVGNADVSSVLVNCAPGTYTVGGTMTGLVGSAILQQNGAADLTLTSDGSFAFAQTLAPGSLYSVTVSTQPTYPPRSQTCTVTNGGGTMANANVTNVAISCMTRSYTVGGNASGLTGALILKNNGGDQITANAAGAFVFPTSVASGNTYAVTITTPPPGQTCAVSNGSGTMANGDIGNVSVTCSMPVGNQGILCDGNYCVLGAEECCLSNNTTYSCVAKCIGAGTAPIKCDSASDCDNGLVCCGALAGTTVNNIYCAAASQCTAPKAYFCDPAIPNPCPNGGTCTATMIPPGYYRCF